MNCPCGSGNSYATCCGAIIEGRQAAPTAERLMRSRYTAFTLANGDYLMKSWDPQTRDLEEQVSLEQWARSVNWIKLQIFNTEAGTEEDETGTVSFRAWYREKGKLRQIAEKSFFQKINGTWIYVEGTLLA